MSDYTVHDVPLGFAPIPPQLVMWQDGDGKPLTGTELRVWSMLAMHRSLMTQKTSAGVVRMSKMLDVDRTTIQRAVNRLMKAGFLLHKPRQRNPETGEFTPAEFTLAINKKPLRFGVVDQAHDHDASAHNHDAHHDAHHDAPGDANPNINARAEREVKESRKENNAKASEASLAPEGWHFEEYLRDALQGADVPLTRSKGRRYTGEANKLLKEGVEELELYEACDRVISEWERVRLSLDDALRDLRNGNQSNGTKPSESQQSGTPQALIEYIFANTRNSAIRNNEARIRSALESFDFTSRESVPYPIQKLLGGDDLEVHSVREGIRSLSNRYQRSLEAV